MKISQKNIIELLKSRKIKPSFQRIKIYEYLVTRKNHPSTEMIYKKLLNKIPTFSRTTVYNTMDIFLEKGLVSLISIDDKEARFDADVSVHAHFMCTKCGKIFDVPVNPGEIDISGLSKFVITENHINFKGICETCNAKSISNSN